MKYIIEVPDEIAVISQEFLVKAGLLCEPYTELDCKAIEDEIHVGDEVIAKANMKDALGNFDEPFVVTGMLSCMVVGFGKKYKYHSMGINDVVKTGRHFTKKEIDAIKEYLEVEE